VTTKAAISDLRSLLMRILTAPTPDDLWGLQMRLLAIGGAAAGKAREVAGEFHSCLRELESKVASRSASRWGAILETASVTSVGLQEMMAEQEDPLRRILASGVTAMLEVAAAGKNVQAWEVEASLMYYDVGWYLCGEMWEISEEMRAGLSIEERERYVGQLLKPILEANVSDRVKSALMVKLFQVVLAARVWPLFAEGEKAVG
jgi:hypothetical protein